MKYQIILAITTSALVSAALALPLETETMPVTRNGETKNMLVYPIWSGEYPSPVIDVNSVLQREGKTTVQAEESFQVLGQKKSCTIRNGLIHPWSLSDQNVISYFTISENQTFRLLKSADFSWDNGPEDNKSVRGETGEFLTNVFYLGEGYLMADLNDRNLQLKAANVTIDISFLDDRTQLVELVAPGQKRESEQWVQLQCLNGGTAFVSASDLLKTIGVKEGSIYGYGEVGPAIKNNSLSIPADVIGM